MLFSEEYKHIFLQTHTINKFFGIKVYTKEMDISDSVSLFRFRGYKTFFVLNSVEHEILNAHKYKDIKKFGFF